MKINDPDGKKITYLSPNEFLTKYIDFETIKESFTYTHLNYPKFQATKTSKTLETVQNNVTLPMKLKSNMKNFDSDSTESKPEFSEPRKKLKVSIPANNFVSSRMSMLKTWASNSSQSLENPETSPFNILNKKVDSSANFFNSKLAKVNPTKLNLNINTNNGSEGSSSQKSDKSLNLNDHAKSVDTTRSSLSSKFNVNPNGCPDKKNYAIGLNYTEEGFPIVNVSQLSEVNREQETKRLKKMYTEVIFTDNLSDLDSKLFANDTGDVIRFN